MDFLASAGAGAGLTTGFLVSVFMQPEINNMIRNHFILWSPLICRVFDQVIQDDLKHV